MVDSDREGWNEADRILGADWMMPGQRLLEEAWASHEQHELLVALKQETNEHGEGMWQVCRQVEEDGWVEFGFARGRSTGSMSGTDQSRDAAGEGSGA